MKNLKSEPYLSSNIIFPSQERNQNRHHSLGQNCQFLYFPSPYMLFEPKNHQKPLSCFPFA